MSKLPERGILEGLVEVGNKFRRTPIIDDDFPAIRDEFDALLDKATVFLKENGEPCVTQQRMIADGCMGQHETTVSIFDRKPAVGVSVNRSSKT